jgi:hypothetical protein
MGSERKRSKRPLWMSVLSPTPVYTVMKMTVCTSTPGKRYWMYSLGVPASAPPKINVKSRVNMMGMIVTSKS